MYLRSPSLSLSESFYINLCIFCLCVSSLSVCSCIFLSASLYLLSLCIFCLSVSSLCVCSCIFLSASLYPFVSLSLYVFLSVSLSHSMYLSVCFCIFCLLLYLLSTFLPLSSSFSLSLCTFLAYLSLSLSLSASVCLASLFLCPYAWLSLKTNFPMNNQKLLHTVRHTDRTRCLLHKYSKLIAIFLLSIILKVESFIY